MSTGPHEECPDRRHILCGGGAMMFGAMVASLLGASKPVRAQTIDGAVPEVDAVSVRVVVDSYQFAVAASKKTGPVDIQHFGWGLSKDMPPGSNPRSNRREVARSAPSDGADAGMLPADTLAPIREVLLNLQERTCSASA
jgi:hypothetical protein